ncbi:hypothetical protein Cgig2_001302 [Carnegiea gigantea]|uniref:Topoisomerase 6 subunit A/Spo11 TOPRIM domain-containing protein n=1 Tax=Carnegiea gigantea TaxID=171969 RepID=A0A9Q1JTG4_9CARY|nr:hypothetical protein Cgig2_001302 [Carnegiea gigantea]
MNQKFQAIMRNGEGAFSAVIKFILHTVVVVGLLDMLIMCIIKEPDREAVDCRHCGSSGYAISGDLNLLENLTMKTDARYIIVIEKHAIFQRLAEDCFFNEIPSILITAKGYPDLATRFLFHKMSRAFPNLSILALVDWNPAGLAIICTYKYGSIGMGLEAYRYGTCSVHLIYTNPNDNFWLSRMTLFTLYGLACNVRWLGVRGDDLLLIPEESMAPLKPKDLQIAKSLTSLKILPDDYQEELSQMIQSGQRADIEALYCHGYGFLGRYLAKKIVQANYI